MSIVCIGSVSASEYLERDKACHDVAPMMRYRLCQFSSAHQSPASLLIPKPLIPALSPAPDFCCC